MTESTTAGSLDLKGTREQYSGVVVGFQRRISTYSGLYERKIVLDRIQGPSSELLSKDRQTFSFGKRFQVLNLQVGDRVTFNARIVLGKSGTFKLVRATKISTDELTIQTTLDGS